MQQGRSMSRQQRGATHGSHALLPLLQDVIVAALDISSPMLSIQKTALLLNYTSNAHIP